MGEDKRKQIIQLVYSGKLSAEEGTKIYKELTKQQNFKAKQKTDSKQVMDIAIIGMSGRFPKAKNVDEYWDNLKNGTNCIQDLYTRWNIDYMYSADRSVPNKSYCRWGGLIDEVNSFDPIFFELSPRQAELMEPRQRLFLMEAWRSIEDAGYSQSDLNAKLCGVFVGCEGDSDYFDSMKREKMNGHVVLGHSNAILAARIAYFMNLQGPSVTIDTACSSSLVAIHQACLSIIQGDCEIAIAGGTTVITNPGSYVLLCSMGMLSPDGQCKTFDESANGFVPGECVASVILKPLQKAIEDGDHIYGVIKGSGINQDGKTNGITAPSALSQERLEKHVYNTFDILPKTISYVEAHGTGTRLGDPIEIEALTQAFEYKKNEGQYCGIGSVKTNIGHTSASSGIASLIKVLLAMKHGYLPPSLNYKEENKQIHFNKSPFYAVNELKEWNVKGYHLKRAAISSFGQSGTNCHMVVEEFIQQNDMQEEKKPCYMMTFSAKTQEVLKEKLVDFYKWLDKEGDTYPLDTLSFNLLNGRTHFNYRACFKVKDMPSFKMALREVIETGNSPHYQVNFYEKAPKNKTTLQSELNTILEQTITDIEMYDKNLERIIELYLAGYELDWLKLYKNPRYQRISMPTYPFNNTTYTLHESDKEENTYSVERLGPLIDSNESTFNKQCFKKVFTGEEFYLQDHMRMLPGVVYMEMVRTAGELAHRQLDIIELQNVVWVQPITVPEGEKVSVYINLYPKNGEKVNYEVTTEKNGEILIHSTGTILYGQRINQEKKLDINEIFSRCRGGKEAADFFYNRMENLNVNLGSRFRGMQEIFFNEKEAISTLAIPEVLESSVNDYVIHPTLVDGGFESVVTWLYHTVSDTERIFLPFSLGKLEVVNPERRICHAYISRNSQDKIDDCQVINYNISFLDKDGYVVFYLRNYSIRQFKPELFLEMQGGQKSYDTLYYKRDWVKYEINSNDAFKEVDIWVILDKNQELYEQLKVEEDLRGARLIWVKDGSEFKKLGSGCYSINPCNREDYSCLIDEIYKDGSERVLYIYNWTQYKGELNEKLNLGPYSIFHLVQTLLKKPIHNKTKLLCINKGNPVDTAISGFANTLHIEKRQYDCCTLQVEENVSLVDILKREIGNEVHTEVMYKNNERFVKQLEEVKLSSETRYIKNNGVYIITGGAGGLGLIFAEHLANRYKAQVILVGRSLLTKEKQEKIKEISVKGKEVIYRCCDLTNQKDVEKLIMTIKQEYKVINGIIHAAGVIKDNVIARKKIEDFEQVIAPKLYGTLNLMTSTKQENLDFMVLFSSTSSVMGNMGQCDYSYGNSFIDHLALKYADYEIWGRVVAINWPLWANGGMQISEQIRHMLKNTYGMIPLENNQGIDALEKCLNSGQAEMVVLGGEIQKIRTMIDKKKIAVTANTEEKEEKEEKEDKEVVTKLSMCNKEDSVDKDKIANSFKEDMLQMICEILSIDRKMVKLDSNLSEFGFDSISFTELSNKINERYDLDITPAIFFGYTSLDEMVDSLLKDYTSIISKFYISEEKEAKLSVVDTRSQFVKSMDNTTQQEEKKMCIIEAENSEPNQYSRDNIKYQPIAIIGMSGAMPQSDNLEEFWKQIRDSKDLISEIPQDRWDWKKIYGDPNTEEGKTDIIWGGFMKQIDEFDPLFFGISGSDAEVMDPQERLVLQTVWHTVEDAGYKISDLSESDTGVFIGVSSADYKEILLENHMPTILSQTFIANRVSYAFNLHGPSEAIDTACSSSLVAVHRAVEAIQKGDCHLAIAGGVNVITSPNLYITQSKMNMLSKDGRCKTFDRSANGYVRGEGIATILLKPLYKAEQDGDHIYGIIKGSAINHGGHATNLFAPNAKAQADVIIKAYEKGDINPKTVSYIETHGTGTSLGDPVETEGLKMAFKHLYDKYQETMSDEHSIILGAVKANIGHLEAASGIAGLIKILYEFKHNELLKILHFNNLNPYIKLKNTPFTILTENTKWENKIDIYGKAIPRRASISSFGVGGVNAHIVLEDYPEEKCEKVSLQEELIIISATDKERLKLYVEKIQEFVEEVVMSEENYTESSQVREYEQLILNMVAEKLQVEKKNIDILEPLEEYGVYPFMLNQISKSLEEKYGLTKGIQDISGQQSIRGLAENLDNKGDMERNVGMKKNISRKITLRELAYTLQVGREELDARVAFIAKDMKHLNEQLKAYNRNEQLSVYEGNLSESTMESNTEKIVVETLLRERKLQDITMLWVKGVSFDWDKLYINNKPKRISVPGYPFAKEHYWVEIKKKDISLDSKVENEFVNCEELESYLQDLYEQKIKLR